MSTKRITIKQDGEEGSDQNVTFEIQDEGHTLGNALQNIISQYPDVGFCGYSIPSFLDNYLNFKIQTKNNVKSVDVLKRGLEDLIFLCEHILDKTKSAMK
ncbi:hypothetical protein PVAND_010851 [Polypedilum vanderplanki]|uniref:DNA-directed RNA polymerase RBP11-like dimerisation domain-containing protein n=1 Tax=Polypedilum vanderplanki TaxID=319348 RepID=A0A9J6CHI8_POLVA|nr:hypothetical protein PVAND_010851 [Polypedilum vanderplanki]